MALKISSCSKDKLCVIVWKETSKWIANIGWLISYQTAGQRPIQFPAQLGLVQQVTIPTKQPTTQFNPNQFVNHIMCVS